MVGEILVKYSPTANNDIVRLLEEEEAEVEAPADIVGFMNYSFVQSNLEIRKYGHVKTKQTFSRICDKNH